MGNKMGHYALDERVLLHRAVNVTASHLLADGNVLAGHKLPLLGAAKRVDRHTTRDVDAVRLRGNLVQGALDTVEDAGEGGEQAKR